MSEALPGSGHLGETPYRYRISRSKGRIIAVAVGVVVPDSARFTLRREGETDRLAKAIGLAREWQTQDGTFDERVYIQSDDTHLHEALSLDARLREAIVALMQLPRVKALQMGKGALTVDVGFDREHYGAGIDSGIAQRLAERALPHLQVVRERLAAPGAMTWGGQRDPGLQRYKVILAVSAVTGAAGLATLVAQPGPELPYALVREQIHRHAWMVALAGLAIASMLVFALLGRRSRTHRALAAVLFLATPGIWCAASVYFELQNNAAPAGEPVLSYVASKEHVPARRRRSEQHFLTFTVVPDARMSHRVEVSRDVYVRHAQGQCVWLDVRHGGLGDPVLHGIQPATCAGPSR